ncbi:MAG TPA: ABC transporter permease [Candidatus Saccharibacteria bacterium]|nr:ABC transporter permease [Candidatus Saccharibacteria bacterium]
MFRSIFTKTLYDKRWFMLGWGLGAVSLLALTAAFFPSLSGNGMDALVKSLPPELEGILGDVEDWSTYPGYLASAVFGLRGEMLFVPMAILLGVGLGMGDESNRRLYQLLAKPVSRRRVVLERWLAGLVVIAVVTGIVYASLVVVSPMIGEDVPYELLNGITVITALFTAALFSLTYGLGVATGRKNLAILVPVVWTMGSLLVDAFKLQIDWLKDLEWVSLLSYYKTADLVHDDINLNHVVVLGCIALISLIVALIAFQNRDIHEEA